MDLVRELLFLAVGVSALIVVIAAVVLTVSGVFSLPLFARTIFLLGFVAVPVDLFIHARALRVSQVRGPFTTWHMTDRTQGCGVAMLGGLVALGLLACGGLLELWLGAR
jgi:hypothetical protein